MLIDDSLSNAIPNSDIKLHIQAVRLNPLIRGNSERDREEYSVEVAFVIEPAADGEHLVVRTLECETEDFDPSPDAKNVWMDCYNSVSENESNNSRLTSVAEGVVCSYDPPGMVFWDKNLSPYSKQDAYEKAMLLQAMTDAGLVERTGEIELEETELHPPRPYEKVIFTQKLINNAFVSPDVYKMPFFSTAFPKRSDLLQNIEAIEDIEKTGDFSFGE